jgi:hypothetical protein
VVPGSIPGWDLVVLLPAQTLTQTKRIFEPVGRYHTGVCCSQEGQEFWTLQGEFCAKPRFAQDVKVLGRLSDC